MAEIIIDGKAVAAAVNAENARKCEELAKKYGSRPGLAVVLVGDDPASQVYVSSKVRKCGELGIYSEKIVLPKDSTQQQVLDVIDTLNKNPEIHGILVQSPPPPQISEEEIILAIDPKKDVDCFHPYNTGRMLQGDLTGSLPCTPAGVMELLKYYKIPTSGKRAAVLGRSNIVGKPMSLLMLRENATVTVAHSRTANLKEVAKRADILIAAIGKPKMITREYVKEGAVVIDVGINRDADNKLCGDVDFDDVAEICSAITPVPGGVGPMTIAMLLNNCIQSVELQK